MLNLLAGLKFSLSSTFYRSLLGKVNDKMKLQLLQVLKYDKNSWIVESMGSLKWISFCLDQPPSRRGVEREYSPKLLNFASVLTTRTEPNVWRSPGLDSVETVDIQDGDTEGGGALVLMMVWHVHSHQDAAAPHLATVIMSQCYHNYHIGE